MGLGNGLCQKGHYWLKGALPEEKAICFRHNPNLVAWTSGHSPLLTFFLVPQPTFGNKHRRSCLASGRSVSGWGLVAHGAMALQPNGFRFLFDTPEGVWLLSQATWVPWWSKIQSVPPRRVPPPSPSLLGGVVFFFFLRLQYFLCERVMEAQSASDGAVARASAANSSTPDITTDTAAAAAAAANKRPRTQTSGQDTSENFREKDIPGTIEGLPHPGAHGKSNRIECPPLVVRSG